MTNGCRPRSRGWASKLSPPSRRSTSSRTTSSSSSSAPKLKRPSPRTHGWSVGLPRPRLKRPSSRTHGWSVGLPRPRSYKMSFLRSSTNWRKGQRHFSGHPRPHSHSMNRKLKWGAKFISVKLMQGNQTHASKQPRHRCSESSVSCPLAERQAGAAVAAHSGSTMRTSSPHWPLRCPWRSCSSAGRCKAQFRRGSSPIGRRSGVTPAPTEYCLGYNLPRKLHYSVFPATMGSSGCV